MILVTGGTGLVGAHLLLHLLQSEDAVRAIYRNEESIKKTKAFFALNNQAKLFLKIEWVKADLIDVPALEVAFKDINYVYHCAALVSFEPKDEKKLRKTNIEGTANIVNLSIAFNIKKLCYVSSIAALGETLAKDKVITETTDWNPELYHGDYAITKYGAEMEVWRGTQEGLDVIIVNPGIIFGRGFGYEGSGAFFQKVKKDFPFYTKGIAGIVGVNDVVNAMCMLMNSEVKNERFALVSDNISYQELINYIADLMGKKHPSIKVSRTSSVLAWKLDDFVSLITRKKRSFTRSLAQASHSKYVYDCSKIKNTISFEFEHYQSFLPLIAEEHLR
ncbi:NAD-dependent epimerase/dehydratase family protein [Myroides marinus]|uniref:NAD-dependent epimerase/dehydratase family protein n=1 Tax=Myroides marinus TaxID=703342 RepID=UPI002577D0BE|nr:NAD-dependent epimerase/dehydratase family protein [Myroides marinus]MDM1345478.1 NAD-dependent epimerase/dehydratase family protein [Myroides marinus]MDM1349067.1 NAD-dependent epimerase/dehydratase family protein [Myroides marinus]MDM1352713.1 NAD-dependent epimerase/dehydratase family protein [Myroides marinus]MDM1356277.1 NAD-dependent epimerase/dehydratase family protein [Myroides marinus]MDM1360059.1 NAD-dependent epimerase/dehydratase family protein [Myroides marinus]